MHGYYIDIKVINSEINSNYIIAKLYDKLHLCFVEIRDSDGKMPIGVGFPEYIFSNQEENFNDTDFIADKNYYIKKKKKDLGRAIRLFSPHQKFLENHRVKHVLESMKQYLSVSDIRTVPNRCSKYSIYKRIQADPDIARLAKRKAKRANIAFEEALTQLQKESSYQQRKLVNIPYINMKSRSSNNHFKLFIQEFPTDHFNYEGFNSYGLSNSSTIPNF